jgi:hypothetical protein
VISGLSLETSRGALAWRHNCEAREAILAGAAAALAEGDRIIVLVRWTGGSALAALDAEGREIGRIAAPAGITLSHFGEDGLVVGQGEAPVDGWWDWHFEADWGECRMRRTGPAY